MDWGAIAATGGLIAGFAVVLIAPWWWLNNRGVSKARAWPQAEATIETAAMCAFSAGRAGKVMLPTFAFSYKIDSDFYSGRFSLMPHGAEVPDEFLQRQIGRKLQIHYNPHRPEQWFIHDETIEGYKVQQKIGVHITNFYPA